MQFSLFYFANHAGEDHESGKYALILKSAKWADENGFTRLWTPERHFHSFGGLSPNPSVLAAAIAALTKNIQICSQLLCLLMSQPAGQLSNCLFAIFYQAQFFINGFDNKGRFGFSSPFGSKLDLGQGKVFQ